LLGSATECRLLLLLLLLSLGMWNNRIPPAGKLWLA
jgi:hypothetical protein